MADPVKIMFGVLSTYERHGWHHPSITQFFADLPFMTGVGYRMIPINNFQPAAAGRNVFCRNFKDCDADWLAMIDNDMHIPANLIDAIKDAPADAGIVVPTFYLWDQTKTKLVLCWGKDDVAEGSPVKQFTPGFHELTKCGTGVIFIRPSVIRQMDYPYFKYLYNEDQGMAGTEDIQFCLSARQKGVKIYGTTAVKIGHYHTVELSSLWDWANSLRFDVNKIDKDSNAVANSEPKDAESPSVPVAVEASPAETACR